MLGLGHKGKIFGFGLGLEAHGSAPKAYSIVLCKFSTKPLYNGSNAEK